MSEIKIFFKSFSVSQIYSEIYYSEEREMSLPLKRPVEDGESENSPIKQQRSDDCSNLKDEFSEQQIDSRSDLSPSVEAGNDQNLASKSASDPKTNYIELKERDMGITEYISDLPGFSAVIKERYSDFLVNEIDLDGNLVRLTNLKKPREAEIAVENDALTDDELGRIEELQYGGLDNAAVVIDVTNKNKEQRTKIHQLIRKTFQGLDSATEMIGKANCIVIKKGIGNRRRSRLSEMGNYTHFVLYKENRDTMDAVNTIASTLRVTSKHFSYAGTKDKRAKTVQRVSVYQVHASRLLSLNNKFKQIKIGNLEYKHAPLKLGDLRGNHFSIILRQFKGDIKIFEAALSSLSKEGFLNYYGMQRFGTTSIATHRVGKALLLSQWKEAIGLILQPRSEDEDDDVVAAARKTWSETCDAREALRKLNHRKCIEGRLLVGLAEKESNLLQALDYIPRNTRLMYIHSYQSYIWNKVLSHRVKEFGLKVQVGDLVYSKTSNVCDGADVSSNDSEIRKLEPEFVTDDNLNEKTIYDVVLPLPGHCIKYPENITKTWYDEFLKEDGMDFSSFKSNVKAYSLTGAYRKIVIKPTEVKWEALSYQDNTLPLVLSDWEILKGEKLPPPTADDDMKGDEMKTAVKLELVLPSSTYATMAVREVLKLQNAPCVD